MKRKITIIVILISMALMGCSISKDTSTLNSTKIPSQTNQTDKNNDKHNELPIKQASQFIKKIGDLAYIDIDGNLVIFKDAIKRVVTFDKDIKIKNFSWSPNGKHIALILDDSTQSTLAIYYMEEDDIKKVNKFSQKLLSSVSWAPKGSYVLLDFGTAPGGKMFQVVSSKTWGIIYQGHYAYGIKWGSNGKTLVYGKQVETPLPLPLGSGEATELARTLLPDGVVETLIKTDQKTIYFPIERLSKNKVLINKTTYSKQKGTTTEIVKYDLITKQILNEKEVIISNRKLVVDRIRKLLPPVILSYSWAPQDKYVAFAVRNTRKDNKKEVYIMNWQTNNLYYIDGGISPQWSPRSISNTN